MGKKNMAGSSADTDILKIDYYGIRDAGSRFFGCPSFWSFLGRVLGIFIIFHPAGFGAIAFSLKEMASGANMEARSWLGLIILFILGLLLVLVGLILLFRDTLYVLDRREGALWKRSNILFIVKRKKYSLGDFKSVRVYQLVVDTRSGVSLSYPLELTNVKGFHHVELMKGDNYHEIHFVAEKAARFLNVPFEDQHAGVTLNPEDYLKADRAAFQVDGPGGVMVMPPKPAFMHSVVEEGEREVVVRIPGRKESLLPAFAASVIFIVLLLFICSIFRMIIPEPIFTGLLIAVPCVVLLGLIMKIKKRKIIEPVLISASSAELSLEEGDGSRKRTVRIPVPEIQELLMPSFQPSRIAKNLIADKGILVRSDRESIEFGRGLAEAEARYIYALVRNALFPRAHA